MAVNNVKKLSPRDHVLLRPEVYLGSLEPTKDTTNGYDGTKILEITGWSPATIRMVQEVLDNSVDSAIRSGFKKGKNIHVSFSEDYFEVADDGEGIPIIKDEVEGVYQPELSFAHSLAGSNFEGERSTSGLFGIGVFAVNVMSFKVDIETIFKKKKYTQTYRDNCSVIDPPEITNAPTRAKGTKVRVYLDTSKVPWTTNEVLLAMQMLNNIMFCYPELTVTCDICSKSVTLLTPDEFVKQAICEPICDVSKGPNRIAISSSSNFQSWVNGTQCRGVHLTKLKKAISDSLLPKLKISTLEKSDISRSLGGLVSIRVRNPVFKSLTKLDLDSCDGDSLNEAMDSLIKPIVTALAADDCFISNMKQLVKSRGHKNLRKAERRAGKKVDKLVDCTSNKIRERWLFITEGDSARGQFVQARDPKYHAIYCLRGKTMNAIADDSTVKLQKSKALLELSAVLGLSMTSSNTDAVRYSKICIATDADHDGSCICGLLLAFFYRFWPSLLEDGSIYRLLTPRYILGKRRTFAYVEDDIPEKYNGEIRYIKGLGSLSLKDVERIMGNPTLERMNMNKDAEETFQLVFSNGAKQRKDWLSGTI